MPLARVNTQKTAFTDQHRRTLIMQNIINLMDSGNNFLLLGHSHPDDDCIASLVAFALLAVKFNKQVTVLIPGPVQDSFPYLLAICRYNAITTVSRIEDIPDTIEIIAVLDTPKPEMLESYSDMLPFFDRVDKVIEIDHHIAADARYIGDEQYSLVDAASSTCELIGLMVMELEKHEDILEQYQIHELFSRNLVLALITGILSDTSMGKYLKTDQEKWFYTWITGLFDKMLLSKTRRGSRNLASKEDVFKAINTLTEKEENCYRFFLEQFQSHPFINYVVLTEEQSARMFETYGGDIFISVAKTIADVLAEKSKYLGLVAYYDTVSPSGLVQFRIRRSHLFQTIDLRTFLETNHIDNGGGHPGAIGFRFHKNEIDNINEFSLGIVTKASKMVETLL